MTIAEEWTLRRRATGLVGPIVMFALAWSALGSGSVVRRMSLVPVGLLVGAALFAIPAGVVLWSVRIGVSFLVCLLSFVVSVAVALVLVERSDSSTKGLLLMWIPYISVIAALAAVPVDWWCRRTLRRPAR